jgi:hypothetical protein
LRSRSRAAGDLVPGDPDQPARQGGLGRIERVAAPPRGDEHLLGDFLGIGGVAEPAQCQLMDQRRPPPEGLSERVLLAGGETGGDLGAGGLLEVLARHPANSSGTTEPSLNRPARR